MKVIETHFKGCFLIDPTVFSDERGTFFESFNHQKFEEIMERKINFVQDNQSASKKGVIRGLHTQNGEFSQAKLVRVISGKVLDVIVDVRKKSSTFGKVFSCVLSKENNHQLFVPKGFLHGFSVLEDNTVFSYKCDNYYHPKSEDGVRFDDIDLNIDWKIKESEMIISEKDKKLKSFKEFII